jgi:hypothetical protein
MKQMTGIAAGLIGKAYVIAVLGVWAEEFIAALMASVGSPERHVLRMPTAAASGSSRSQGRISGSRS